MKTKLQKLGENAKLMRCGGLIPIIKSMFKKKIPTLIDKELGERPKQAKYSFSDVILSWCFGVLGNCGRVFHLKEFQQQIDGVEGFVCASYQTVLRQLKALTVPNIKVPANKKYNPKNKFHTININSNLIKLLIKVGLRLKVIDRKTPYVLDVDTAPLTNKKCDGTKLYNGAGKRGYQPLYATLSDGYSKGIPVYIENRLGHVPPAYFHYESTINAITMLHEQGVQVSAFRGDNAYHKCELVEALDEHGILFFTRAFHNQELYEAARDIFMFEPEKVAKWWDGGLEREAVSVYFTQKEWSKQFRYVVVRTKVEQEDEAGGHKIGDYRYAAVCTNDYGMEEQDVIHFYKMRAVSIEDEIGNFHSHVKAAKLPFSFCEQNAVFLLVSAIANMIFRYALDWVSSKWVGMTNNQEICTFIRRFILRPVFYVQFAQHVVYHVMNDDTVLQKFLL